MTLYHCNKPSQLFNCIVHKLHNKIKQPVLLLPRNLYLMNPDFKEVLDFFFDIMLFDSYEIDCCNENNYNNFSNCFKKYKCGLTKFSTILVMGSDNCFCRYLAEKNISFIILRDNETINSNNLLFEWSSSERIVENFEDSESNFFLNITPSSSNLKATRLNDFNVLKILQNFGNEREIIINSYKKPLKIVQEDINNIDVIFVTQNFSAINYLTFESQVLIYQLVIDYFFNSSRVLIFVHPDDIMYYSKILSSISIYREILPFELLPFTLNSKEYEIATINSKQIQNIGRYFKSYFSFDNDFIDEFNALHKQYVAMKLIENLPAIDINLFGVNTQTYLNLQNHSDLNFAGKNLFFSQTNSLDNASFLIDDVLDERNEPHDELSNLLNALNDDNYIIFVNTRKTYSFFNCDCRELWSDIIPICITKEVLNTNIVENFYSNIETDVIYFYSKNKELRNTVKKINFTKELENSNLRINVKELTDDQNRIKVLEGLLAATEKRLLYYINLSKKKAKGNIKLD